MEGRAGVVLGWVDMGVPLVSASVGAWLLLGLLEKVLLEKV
jgi:hypothetical protein